MLVRSPVPAEQAIARKVRALRQESGWSQDELARRMTARGWSWYAQTVGRVEGGQRHLRFGEIDDLAAIFGVDTAAFLGEIGIRPAAAARAAIERDVLQQLATEFAGRAQAA